LTRFRSLLVLKRSLRELWTTMRDHLPEFAGNIADIEEIREIERRTDPDGAICVVNQWSVRQQLPATLSHMLNFDRFTWLDRNRWDLSRSACHWSIEPSAFGEHITCRGETGFAPAMGGQGTRITFVGELDISPSLLGTLTSVAPMLPGIVESIATTVIPRNLRAVAEAAAEYHPDHCG
jgi:hypothetical protein